MVGLLVILALGVSGIAKAACLLAACLLVAAIVVLLPHHLRARFGSFSAAFVAAAGVLPMVASSDPKPTPKPVNAHYLADLVRQGPFAERLPSPLRATKITDVGIGDPSAKSRIDAVRIRIDGGSEIYVFAMIEIYPTALAAERRKAARIRFMVQNYGRKNVYDGCTDEYGAHGGGWTCVDVRGNAYAEAAVSPSINAYTPLAVGTLAAMLRYTDRLSKLAT